jgi:uncharacterized protein YjlB
MSQISPSKVLAEVAAAVPKACLENIVVIGSLAAGYHFFKDDPTKAVRTKEVDCVLAPFQTAVSAGQSTAAIQVLGAFAANHQILIFTCHPNHAGELQSLVGAKDFQITT